MLARLLALIPRRPRPPRCPDWIAEQVDAIRTLEGQGLLTRAEAGVLRNGERIADHYADIDAGDREHLDEVEALLRAGELAEALVQLGRFRPQLADLPRLHARSLASARG